MLARHFEYIYIYDTTVNDVCAADASYILVSYFRIIEGIKCHVFSRQTRVHIEVMAIV